MTVIALLALVLLVPALIDVAARPSFRRLAMRNASRRKGEAVLVIVGSLLGTAIITASFVVGDTIQSSFRDGARTNLGPIDESVRAQDLGDLDAMQAALSTGIPGTTGTLAHLSAGAVVSTVGDQPLAEPAAGLVEIDFDEGRALGASSSVTGLADAGATPGPGEAVVNERLADTLGLAPGDEIEVYLFGSSVRLRVRQVLQEVGIAGYLPVKEVTFGPAVGSPVFVAPGTIEPLAAASTVATAAPPVAEVLVSNTGEVFSGADTSEAVSALIDTQVEGIEGVEVVELKKDLLDTAAVTGDGIGQLYFSIGSFSVIAGILLLVNLFVMLAEERKRELGMLRAVGFKRNHLMRTFAIEGSLYSVVASILGAILGVGVGWVITQAASRIFAEDSSITYTLSASPSTLLLGGGIGLVISMLTVWGTSMRISRLNVIRAIRELPEPSTSKQRLRSLLLGLAGVGLGALVFMAGASGGQAVLVMAGPAIALFSAIPVLSRFLPRRPVVLGLGALVLVWGITVFTVAGELIDEVGVESFVIQGVVLVAASITIIASSDRAWAALADRMLGSGRGLALRLGLAYPLARRFRTSMLLAMFAIVIFTMTFISVFSHIFGNQAPGFATSMAAGYDLYLDSNPGNPATVEQLLSQPDVVAVAPLVRGYPQFSIAGGGEPVQWPVAGFDEALLAEGGVPELNARDDRFPDDRAAFDAVLADPSLVIVDDFFLQQGGGPPEGEADVGDTITVLSPVRGESVPLTVVGVMDSDLVFNGAFMSATAVRDLLGTQSANSRVYVQVAEGASPEEVALALSGALLRNGADGASFLDQAQDQVAQQQSFFTLMRGYLGLGLLIGIAGLGVVMVRAVRERRRQIGMLRAMGFSSAVVRRAFLLEASFVALQGIVLGIVLGLVASWQLLANSSAFGDQELDFGVPWFALAVIVALPFLASVAATLVPASQAARIRPAAALRIAD